jgi:hypothetical protein
MAIFSQFIGIDYSGAGAPTERQSGIQVYRAWPGGMHSCNPASSEVQRV